MWTEECPDYLLGQGQKNIGILSSRQEDYVCLTWPECKDIVGKLSHNFQDAVPPVGHILWSVVIGLTADF